MVKTASYSHFKAAEVLTLSRNTQNMSVCIFKGKPCPSADLWQSQSILWAALEAGSPQGLWVPKTFWDTWRVLLTLRSLYQRFSQVMQYEKWGGKEQTEQGWVCEAVIREHEAGKSTRRWSLMEIPLLCKTPLKVFNRQSS